MSTLFERTSIKDLHLDNRLVRSATWMGMAAPDGACTPELIDVKARLAAGGVGLIITGFAYVQRNGQPAPWMLGCHDDSMLPGLTGMAQAVHRAGGKVALQLAHGGVGCPAELIGETARGASPLLTEAGPVGRAMTAAEIDETVEAFGAAADRAVRAGFDAVQIHAAHGYLLSQFLSPYYNRRDDDYGGPLQNRARLLLQVVDRVQDAVDDGMPVLVKLNADDMLPGGIAMREMLAVSAMLQEAGVDAIEVSGGTTMALLMGQPENSYARTGDARLYWREAAERYRQEIDVPLILVGGIRSLSAAKEIVARGLADYVALCRPLIRQPDLPNLWKAGLNAETDCISCNSCFGPGIQGQGVRCMQIGS